MAYLNESHIEVADINFFTEKFGYSHREQCHCCPAKQGWQ